MKYDIFISYRRKELSSNAAKFIYNFLHQRGYSVFVDKRGMSTGEYPVQLHNHITNATDIIILLEEESLDAWFNNRFNPSRCELASLRQVGSFGDEDFLDVRESDSEDIQKEPYQTNWFCKEVMFTLSLKEKNKEKNIIPILLNGYGMPDGKDLPPEMKRLSDYHALEMKDLFDAEDFCIDLIEKDLLHSKPRMPSQTQRLLSKDGVVGCFLLYTESGSCDVYEGVEVITTLTDDCDQWHPYVYFVSFAGEHRFKAVHNDSCDEVTIISSVETNCQKFVPVSFNDTRNLWELTKEEINAQTDIDLLCRWGKGLFKGTTRHNPDVALSFECLIRAIDLGSQEALSFVSGYGTNLIKEKHAPQEVAVQWYQIAAEQGNRDAQCSMGKVFLYGIGTKPDYSKAFEWCIKGADQGAALAQRLLGTIYRRGLGVEQDFVKAMEWYLKSAEQGDAIAQWLLGNMFWDGKGVEQDYAKAFEWYLKAAEQGDRDARILIGTMYRDGLGVKQDYAKAMEWYLKSAEQDETIDDSIKESCAVAQRFIGNLFRKGLGVEQDFVKATEWYLKAAEQGDAISQRLLGKMYGKGLGVEQDYAKAFEWCLKAAEQGDAISQRLLGIMYGKGLGVEQDYTKAFEWYLKASEQGDAKAQHFVGNFYYEGQVVEKDYAKALEWYLKSADQGHALAFNSLAWTYHLKGDYKSALPWAEKAADALPDKPYVIDTLATVYEGLDRYEEALKQFEKCLRMCEEAGNEDKRQRTAQKIAALKDKMK